MKITEIALTECRRCNGILKFGLCSTCHGPEINYSKRLSNKKYRETRNRILTLFDHKCFYCGIDADVIDHKIPLSIGGSNNDENLTASCLKCNSVKSNRTPEEYLKFKKRCYS